MANVGAVAVAAFIHAVLGISIFVEPNYKACSPLTSTPSWIFLLVILEIIWDTDSIPERYRLLPIWLLWVVEVILGVLYIEFGTIIIWCNLEKLLYRLQKSAMLTVAPKMNDCIGDIIIESGAIATSALILFYVSQGTDLFYQIKKRFGQMWKRLRGGGRLSSLKSLSSCRCQLDESHQDSEDEFSSPCNRGSCGNNRFAKKRSTRKMKGN